MGHGKSPCDPHDNSGSLIPALTTQSAQFLDREASAARRRIRSSVLNAVYNADCRRSGPHSGSIFRVSDNPGAGAITAADDTAIWVWLITVASVYSKRCRRYPMP